MVGFIVKADNIQPGDLCKWKERILSKGPPGSRVMVGLVMRSQIGRTKFMVAASDDPSIPLRAVIYRNPHKLNIFRRPRDDE